MGANLGPQDDVVYIANNALMDHKSNYLAGIPTQKRV